MTLISFEFLMLVVITGIIYFVIPEKIKKYQWVVLLAASLFFYVFTCNKYSLYLAATVITTYLSGLWLQKVNDKTSSLIKENKAVWSADERKKFKDKMQSRKKMIVALTLVFNFGILAVIKYLGFIFKEAEEIFKQFGMDIDLPAMKLVLPLGISFYTFQAMGYIIDIYRKKVTAERNFGKLTLFLTFFPQIIQGPIGIYSQLAHQLYEPHKFSYERFRSGAILIFWGLFKKLIIADRAVNMIQTIAGNTKFYSGTFHLLAALIYAIQLYADFSGGIDICRGIAEIFGITMAENFKRPYFSTTLTEYWHRWHITLGDWLRNYLFYPISLSKPFLKMGKSLKKVSKNFGKIIPTSIASLITFVVIGIWHGAELRYVAFGLWNGGIIMLSSLMQPVDKKLCKALHINTEKLPYRIFAMIRTFIIVLVGYFFDISISFMSAIRMMYYSIVDFHISDLSKLFDFKSEEIIKGVSMDSFDLIIILVATVVIFVVSLIQEKSGKSIRGILSEKKLPVQWIFYLLLIISVAVFGHYGPGVSPADFVYMQF